MTASRAERLMQLVSLALGVKLHVEGGQREVAAEELSLLADDALSLRAELVPGVMSREPCSVCGLVAPSRAVDTPTDLIPAGQRFAALVRDYVANGEQLVDVAYVPIDIAGAVLLGTEALRHACPADTDFATWVDGFVRAWEMAS